jgi:DNA invertase Pin-like site-specific DNA recombinase
MRAVIYARYSSDKQRDASIEDQIEVCRRLIPREGWTPAGVYEDRAISGANRLRGGYQQLRTDVRTGSFDIIVCEALDRMGRNLSEVADLHDELGYLGIKLMTVATGEVTALHIGMLGTMAQMTLADLKEKTKRGQLGRALQGKIPGGLAFGYDVIEAGAKDGRGRRRINESEAAIVRRIFETYANGSSPRAIARMLNAEGAPGPDGRDWRDTTIRGQVDRGTGILNNALYVGRLEWNRCSYVKNPRTGRRVARVNPKEQWEVVEVPDLTGGSSCFPGSWSAGSAAAGTRSSARIATAARPTAPRAPA